MGKSTITKKFKTFGKMKHPNLQICACTFTCHHRKEVHLHNGLLHMQQLSTFRMWQKTLIFLLFNTIFSIQNNKNCMKNDVIPPLVKVVDCTEPDAIYQYDYKVPN